LQSNVSIHLILKLKDYPTQHLVHLIHYAALKSFFLEHLLTAVQFTLNYSKSHS